MPSDQKMKLSYFNVKAKAYPLRLMLNAGNVDFEDCKYEFPDWVKVKADMPMGQMPVLEYKNQKLCQTTAIAEFIAAATGLAPKDAWQKSKVMEVICTCDDIDLKFSASKTEQNPEKKKELRDKLCKEVLTSFLVCLDKVIGSNTKPGYCVGDTVTAADFYIFSVVDKFKCEQYEHIPSTYIDQFTNMAKVYETVSQLPKVKECKAVEDLHPYKV